MAKAHLVSFPREERNVAWLGALDLPSLEEEVLAFDLMNEGPEDLFRSGIDEWWSTFVVNDCL